MYLLRPMHLCVINTTILTWKMFKYENDLLYDKVLLDTVLVLCDIWFDFNSILLVYRMITVRHYKISK